MSINIQNQFENLLDTELDRREFLAYLGATVLGVLGISSLLKLVTGPAAKKRSTTPGSYGSSTYGGRS
jgi:hypothetical protein